MNTPRHTRPRVGMTLLEVLVVIGIVTLLAGLLLPSLSLARRRADEAQCLNNLRQLALAWTLYAHDSEDRLPLNTDGLFGGRVNWVAGNMNEPQEWGDRALPVDPTRSLLAAYVKTPAVYKCPADESPGVRSISMNCRMNPTRETGTPPRWVGADTSPWEIFRKLTQIQRPSDLFVLLDESATTINDGYFAVDLTNTGDPDGQGQSQPYYLIDYPAVWHSKGAGASYVDGHVEIRRWVESTTFGPVVPRTHTSERDRDARWLQEHATYLRRE